MTWPGSTNLQCLGILMNSCKGCCGRTGPSDHHDQLQSLFFLVGGVKRKQAGPLVGSPHLHRKAPQKLHLICMATVMLPSFEATLQAGCSRCKPWAVCLRWDNLSSPRFFAMFYQANELNPKQYVIKAMFYIFVVRCYHHPVDCGQLTSWIGPISVGSCEGYHS